jgi:hypothetical protein
VALQDIADRLIADLIPLGQRPSDPGITPITVLLGDANDELLDLAPDSRSARAATGFRAIELAGDKLAVPGHDSIRPRHSCDLGEGFAAQAMTNLAEEGANTPSASAIQKGKRPRQERRVVS